MNHEFKLIFDLYDEKPSKDGPGSDWILLRKDCTKKWLVDLNNITDCREVITKRGIPLKRKCEVFSKFESKWFTIKESYSNTKLLLGKIENRIVVKGFKK